MDRISHFGPGVSGRLLLAAGIAVLALGGSAHAQNPVPQTVPEDSAKHVEQLPAAIDAYAPSAVNSTAPSEVQANIVSTYTAQPEADPTPVRPASRPASSFAPARRDGPLPSATRPASNIRPLNSNTGNPQLVSPASPHKDFTYLPRPKANDPFNAAPSSPGAPHPLRVNGAAITSSPQGSGFSSPPFGKPAHKPSSSPSHTAHRAKNKPAAADTSFGASKPTTFNSKLGTTKHKQPGNKHAAAASIK